MEQIARTSAQIGAALRRCRRSAGLSQDSLAAKTKLRQATISALEKGEAGTRLHTLVHVMAALGLEMVIRERTQAADSVEDVF
ncbi:MAG TPA: helix-turn-helix domain-containing protein [Candidatus Binatia bacterium]|nr:helix-turn-helix domain-containing protein [Candidatus Binatia bacterium]